MKKSNITCCLELEKPSQCFFPQGTAPPTVEHWQRHPRESTETAGAQGSSCTEHPLAVLRGLHLLSGAERRTHSC